VLLNEEKGWINFQKQIYGKFFGKMSVFQKFEGILVRKTVLDFNLPLKKQVVMSNSNTFQLNVNTFVKSDDLRRPDKISLKLFVQK